MFKALSKKYLNKLVFGEVRSSETALIKKFEIKEFPSILVVQEADSLDSAQYQGENNVDQISKFLDKYASKQVKPSLKF